MGEIDIGAAIGSGFGLIRRKPEAIVVWGAASVGLIVVTGWLLWPHYLDQIAHAVASARAGGPAKPSPADLDEMSSLQGLNMLQSVGGLMLSAVLQCAVFRAVIRPQEDRWAYMKVGEPELILFGVTFGAMIAAVIAGVVIGIVGGIVVAVLAAMKLIAAAIVVGAALAGLVAWGGAYAWLRLLFLGPMLVDHGRLDISGGLALTRGRAWPLFVIGLAVIAILLAAEIVFVGLLAAIALAMIAPMAGRNPAALTSFLAQPSAWAARLTPWLVGAAVAAVPIYGAWHALLSAPIARAYLDLRGDPADAF